MRPRCCFRYFTFFGINITTIPASGNWVISSSGNSITRLPNSCAPLGSPRSALSVFFFSAPQRHQALALVEPHLDADLSVGGVRLGEAVIDVRAQRLQRQLSVQIPLRARDFGAVQAT